MTKTLHKLPEIRSSRTRPFDRKLLAVGYVRPLLLTTFDHLLNCPQLSSFAIFALGQFPSPRRRSRREIQFDVENAWHSLPLVSIISGPDESTLIQLRLFGIVGVTIHFFHFRKGSTGVGCGRKILSIVIVPSRSTPLHASLIRQENFQRRERDVRMTVLAAIRSEEDVGTPIVRDVRVFPILRAEVRRAVAGVEVVGKIVFTPGAHVGRMGLVAIHKRPRTFRLLRVA
mmetsp:Transcript_3086/g.4911  ORF Transcript_3086/g.4911 Transcript_3086/m.4911 type:complete len:229 (+) Transcript_3086:201-887(+)